MKSGNPWMFSASSQTRSCRKQKDDLAHGLDIPGNGSYEHMVSNSGAGDEFTSSASGAGPGCLKMSHFVTLKKDVTSQWNEELAPALICPLLSAQKKMLLCGGQA